MHIIRNITRYIHENSPESGENKVIPAINTRPSCLCSSSVFSCVFAQEEWDEARQNGFCSTLLNIVSMHSITDHDAIMI